MPRLAKHKRVAHVLRLLRIDYRDVKGRELMTPEGKTISRGDVSEVCVALLDLPDACNSTVSVPATPDENGSLTSGKA